MAALPFMPLYVADYLADAAHLSTLEHGAYLLLIMTYWQRGEALPDDDKKLSRIARLDARNWARVKPQICEFFTTGDSKWLHHRVERELSSVRTKSLKNQKGGLARAEQLRSERLANAQPYITDTDAEKKEEGVTGDYAFSGKVVLLTQNDFDQWQKSYPAVDVRALLQSRDDWLADQSPAVRGRWFNSTSNWLSKKQQEARTASIAPASYPVC